MTYWNDKVAIVTGGSAGLGRSLALRMAEQGARVVVAARGPQALDAVVAEIASVGGQGLTVPTDVTSDEQVAQLVQQTLDKFGRIDAIFNNAGISDRGRILEAAPADFQRMMEVNFLAAVRCTQAAAEHLISQRGHVVNIGSLASKFAPRYLGPYPASKFALAAYSQQLRLELGPQGLHVLLVCPGPIHREQSRTYGAENDPNLPKSAQQPGAGAKTKAINPDHLADLILRSCRKRKRELIVPSKARVLLMAQALSPTLGDYLLNKFT